MDGLCYTALPGVVDGIEKSTPNLGVQDKMGRRVISASQHISV